MCKHTEGAFMNFITHLREEEKFFDNAIELKCDYDLV